MAKDEGIAIFGAEDADDLHHLRSFVAKLNSPENARKFWSEIMTPDERAAVDRAIELSRVDQVRAA